MENCEDLTKLILELFTALYAKDDRIKPSLENRSYSSINEENVNRLERDFLVEELGDALFNLGGAKVRGSIGFLIAFLGHLEFFFFFLKKY